MGIFDLFRRPDIDAGVREYEHTVGAVLLDVRTEEEYAEVAEAAVDFGFENGWIQGFESRDASSDLVGENMTPGEGAVGV